LSSVGLTIVEDGICQTDSQREHSVFAEHDWSGQTDALVRLQMTDWLYIRLNFKTLVAIAYKLGIVLPLKEIKFVDFGF